MKRTKPRQVLLPILVIAIGVGVSVGKTSWAAIAAYVGIVVLAWVVAYVTHRRPSRSNQ